MRWIIRIYTFILLAYTGWRTWDFMINQLPAGETSTWLALLFLFATEAGLAIWHEVSIGHTTTYTQHYVATFLTWLDFAGSLSAGVADMIIRQTMANYAIPPMLATFLIYGLPAIVAANVAGALIFLANDADAQRQRAQRFLEAEATQQAIQEINQHRRRIVSDRKRQIVGELTGDAFKLPENAGNAGNTASTNGHTDEPVKINPTRRRR